MGIKKGRGVISKESVVDTTLKRIREEIIKTKGADSDHRPTVAFDVSIGVMKALCNPKENSTVSSEYHAIPAVPVTSVAKSILGKAKLYRQHKFDVLLVLDGAKHPLKDEEHAIRDDSRANNVDEVKSKLELAYQNPDDYTLSDVLRMRKTLMVPREDITKEVITAARENEYIIICAPFEADSQFVALQNQGIIDLVDSIDTDIVAAGVKRVVQSVTKKGKVKMMSYSKLVEKVLPKEFGLPPNTVLSHEDLIFYVNMLGNDYLPKGKKGDGRAKCREKMKEYLSKTTKEEKQQYIKEYIRNHDTPAQFEKSMFYWVHAPAYLVVPSESQSPKDALKSGKYTIELGSMTADTTQRTDDFYVPEEDN